MWKSACCPLLCPAQSSQSALYLPFKCSSSPLLCFVFLPLFSFLLFYCCLCYLFVQLYRRQKKADTRRFALSLDDDCRSGSKCKWKAVAAAAAPRNVGAEQFVLLALSSSSQQVCTKSGDHNRLLWPSVRSVFVVGSWSWSCPLFAICLLVSCLPFVVPRLPSLSNWW